jgi:hypothetical protein
LSGVHLGRAQWQARADAHERRADALTAAHRERRVAGRPHPVADFLFVYYNHSPSRLLRWHPGPGLVLEDAADSPLATTRFHRTGPNGDVGLDSAAFVADRGHTVRFVRELLTATLGRPATTACFGLHEWAMVYGADQDSVRHDRWPLRLGAAGTDEVVREHQIRCSHFDAYRFFTEEAAPLNTLRPTRETQRDMEQPGCLHAGMDVYKWCFKLAPAVPGELVLDAFELAAEIRVLDMRSSPYDLAGLGLEPVRIETREGKAEFAAGQRAFTTRSNALRRRLVAVCDELLSAH